MLRYRNKFLVMLHDSLMILVAWTLAQLLYHDNFNGLTWANIFLGKKILCIVLAIQVVFFLYFDVQRGVWRFVSLSDLARIIKAVLVGFLVSVVVLFGLNFLVNIPRSIFPIYCILLITLLSGSRLFYRYYKERGQPLSKDVRVLIVGAGSAGEILARNLLRSRAQNYRPVAFVDDMNSKYGNEIHGLRVIGNSEDIPRVVAKVNIDCIIIAIPSASAAHMRRIVELCRLAKVSVKTLPSIGEMVDDEINVDILRDVSLEDLLGREQVQINWEEVQSGIQNKVVLVSGGGGSIGSEICRQVAKFQPKALVVIENCEFFLYKLQQEFTSNFPELICYFYLGSVTDENLVRKILFSAKPHIIFHAAAYKHVPLLEEQIYSAVVNNIFGTQILAKIALESGVEKFVLVSTDKAVHPTNVMGATKRISEVVCQQFFKQDKTKFIIVRFGNVLGSSGSVLPLFKQQLARGGPITVTHPEVSRFFMTIYEAVLLILQASIFGNGREIFVLDMGEPVKIRYLAEQMIRLSHSKHNGDIEIVYSGLRLGEKLYEELFYQHEEVIQTQNKKILQINSTYNDISFAEKLLSLDEYLKKGIISEEELCSLLSEMIPDCFNRNIKNNLEK